MFNLESLSPPKREGPVLVYRSDGLGSTSKDMLAGRHSLGARGRDKSIIEGQ